MNEKEQREIFAKNFRHYIDSCGKSQIEVAKDLGYSYTTLNTWYRGKALPNAAKIQTLADYFGITKSQLLDADREAPDYYYDKETREAADFLFHNPEYRVLFDATRKVRPEDIDFVRQMIDRMKGNDDY